MKEDDLTAKLKTYQSLSKPGPEEAEVWNAIAEEIRKDGAEADIAAIFGKHMDAIVHSENRAVEQARLKQELEEFFRANKSVVISDPTVHRVAHEIRKGAEEIDMMDDNLWDEVQSRVDLHTYGERLSATRPLMLLYDIPEQIKAMVRESVEAYCHSLYTAAISSCRTLVEVAVVDIAVKIGRISDKEQVREMRMCERISSLIDRSVSKSSPLRQDINAFLESASIYVHGDAQSDEDSAKLHIEKAFSLVQQLYGYYQSQYPRRKEEG